jgi:apolipoprotein N-acyltransferase
MWRIFLDRQMDQTAQPAQEPLDLIVWPETAVPFLLSDSGGFFAALAHRSGGVPVAFGIQREDGLRFFNSLAAIDADAQVTAVYDKWHLVPFGEYIPFGDVMATFGIAAFAAQQGNGYSPGPGTVVLDLGKAGRVLPLICYEAVFPQDLRVKGDRPDWILQITNDSWFGNIAGPYQHLAQARLRAIEQGLPLLRSANTGVTAVIDAKGRILDSLPLNTEGILDTAVPPALPPTLYSRTGDLPATILAGLGLLGLIALRRRQSD